MVDSGGTWTGYRFTLSAHELGAFEIDDKSDPPAATRIPLSLLNRHGLVAAAAGKGDVSGRAAPGESRR
jgi:hypothetical protein